MELSDKPRISNNKLWLGFIGLLFVVLVAASFTQKKYGSFNQAFNIAQSYTVTGSGSSSGAATTTEFIGDINPQVDGLYDVGTSTLRWRNALFTGAITVGSCTGCGAGSLQTLAGVTQLGASATATLSLFGGATLSNETVTGTQTLSAQTKQGVLFVGNTGQTTTTGAFTYTTSTDTLLTTTVSSTRLLFDRGSLTQPGLAVGTNPNTGIYGAATSSLDFVVAGTNAMTINGNGILPRFSVLAFPSLGVDIGGVANIFANGYFGTVSSTALRLTGPSASVSGDSSLCRSATSGLVSFNSGATTCTVSSARFKHDIKSMDSSLDLIMSLRPVDYLRNTDNLAEHGLIAEEVEKVDKLSVFYEQDGTTPRGVKYENLVPVLIRAIQDQQKEIEALKQRVSPLEWLYNKLFK